MTDDDTCYLWLYDACVLRETETSQLLELLCKVAHELTLRNVPINEQTD